MIKKPNINTWIRIKKAFIIMPIIDILCSVLFIWAGLSFWMICQLVVRCLCLYGTIYLLTDAVIHLLKLVDSLDPSILMED